MIATSNVREIPLQLEMRWVRHFAVRLGIPFPVRYLALHHQPTCSNDDRAMVVNIGVASFSAPTLFLNRLLTNPELRKVVAHLPYRFASFDYQHHHVTHVLLIDTVDATLSVIPYGDAVEWLALNTHTTDEDDFSQADEIISLWELQEEWEETMSRVRAGHLIPFYCSCSAHRGECRRCGGEWVGFVPTSETYVKLPDVYAPKSH